MELKSRSLTSKEPHVAREPQVTDPCIDRAQQLCPIDASEIGLESPVVRPPLRTVVLQRSINAVCGSVVFALICVCCVCKCASSHSECSESE
ncbi:hypothetical protein EVAR_26451_1 [Eumeta japonica]|uniref:Uncharacterized protein n=1 Tax=Eumeta variegata TaxID=151549 RepID=A0A4C1VNT4_EUMVA|nr:hypothetical protein EVAR_26451_1 [Eumeta japonica]